jgi:heterotetrameric sarcosine oxidase gamma subunit
MPVSAHKEPARAIDSVGARLGRVPVDIVELAALAAHGADADALQSRLGFNLPTHGHSVRTPDSLVLSVRPRRWLVLGAPADAGASVARWQQACADGGTATDLSSGLAALLLTGPAARDVLARGCRLDLDPLLFGAGQAAATIIAQVSVTLCALPRGMLLLTPSSTARHMDEWLAASAMPFGLERLPARSYSSLVGDSF